MPALSTLVSDLTRTKLIPTVVDQVLNGNVLTMRLMRNARTWSGGYKIEVPVNISSYTSLGWYFGFDSFNTTQVNTRTKASWDPAQAYCTVNLSGIQLATNRGEEAVIDLVATELEQRGKDLTDMMGDGVYSDGTGTSSKEITGLQAAVDDSTSIKNVVEVKSDYMLETPSIRQYAIA
jgi:hypothetical protein